jgi:hypothetical protein
MFGPAAPGLEPTSQEADFLSFRRRHTLNKGEQVLKGAGFQNAVGIKDPDPVEFVLQGVGKADPNGPSRAQIRGIANDRDTFREGPVEGLVCRPVVNNDDGIGRLGLPLQPVKHLLDERGLVKAVNVGQNAHRD